MLKYDPAKMVERAKGCLANKKEIIEVADKLSQEGFSNIFFIGVGGTITYAWSIQETLKPLTTLEYHAEHAADFNTLGNKIHQRFHCSRKLLHRRHQRGCGSG